MECEEQVISIMLISLSFMLNSSFLFATLQIFYSQCGKPTVLESRASSRLQSPNSVLSTQSAVNDYRPGQPKLFPSLPRLSSCVSFFTIEYCQVAC